MLQWVHMQLIETLEDALTFIEAGGVTGGDVHDGLAAAIDRIKTKYPKVASEELPEVER